MPPRVSEESAGIPAEAIIVIVVLLIIFWILGGGSIDGIYNLFRGMFTFIFIYLLKGLQFFLHS